MSQVSTSLRRRQFESLFLSAVISKKAYLKEENSEKIFIREEATFPANTLHGRETFIRIMGARMEPQTEPSRLQRRGRGLNFK